MAKADFINHAIPTFDEMDRSLAALTIHQLVKVEVGRVSPTPKAGEAFARVNRKAQSPLAAWRVLDRRLVGRWRWLFPRKSVDSLRLGLSRERYQTAIQDYWKKAAEMITGELCDLERKAEFPT